MHPSHPPPSPQALFKRHAGGDAAINAAELGGLCKELGQTLSEEQVQFAMAKLDLDGDGTIGYNEFLVWWDAGLKVATLLDPEFNKRLGSVGTGPADAVIRRSVTIQVSQVSQ